MAQMTISQKKNCKGCRALCPGFGKVVLYCEFGYNIGLSSQDTWGITLTGVPKEPCPKPTTNSDYVFAAQNYRKRD